MAGQLFTLSAPSGAGKSTIIELLRKRMPGIGYSISHTSRPPRGLEKDAVDYHFVDRKTFEQMIQRGAFVEWAKVFSDYYGTSLAELRANIEQGSDILLDIDPVGAKNIKGHFPDSVLIFILPPSLDILERRLRFRATDTEGVIALRMQKAPQMIKECIWYDYVIINNEIQTTLEEVQAIILADRCRTKRRLGRIREAFHNVFEH